jgi:4-hydroxy-3-methylbut-2-enyl diphosphate reductase IspH
MARRDRKPRNTIAKFVCNKDHENVKKLKVKPQFSINQQYPMEIADRRKEPFPKMRAYSQTICYATLIKQFNK